LRQVDKAKENSRHRTAAKKCGFYAMISVFFGKTYLVTSLHFALNKHDDLYLSAKFNVSPAADISLCRHKSTTYNTYLNQKTA